MSQEDLTDAERQQLARRHVQLTICNEQWNAFLLPPDPDYPGWYRYRLIEGDVVYRRAGE